MIVWQMHFQSVSGFAKGNLECKAGGGPGIGGGHRVHGGGAGGGGGGGKTTRYVFEVFLTRADPRMSLRSLFR